MKTNWELCRWIFGGAEREEGRRSEDEEMNGPRNGNDTK